MMTEYEQKLYDVIADWWDDVFVNNKDKNATIIDLVKSISKIDDWDKPIPEGVDPYNLTGRDSTQSVWKNGKRPSPDYYEILNGKMND
jgi:hypothetical protein